MTGRGRRAEPAAQLGFTFDDDLQPLVRITPSRLATWQDCPRRYRMTYLDQPQPIRSGTTAPGTLGAVVHLALRALYALPVADRTGAAAAALIDRHWSSEGFRDAEQAAVYRERARDWVTGYADAHAGPDATVPDGETVAVERWVSAPVGRLVVQGRIDRIDRRGAPDRAEHGVGRGADEPGGAELVVVDYKTGRTPTESDAAASPALALYAVAVQAALRTPCRRVELHHLPTGRIAAFRHDDTSVTAHLRAAERTAAELSTAATRLTDGDDPDVVCPPRPGPRCGGCDVRRHCPDGRAAAPERSSWAGLAE